MSESMIERLKSVGPQERQVIIHNQYQHNYDFFSQHAPHLARILDEVPNPYDINISPDFLEIVHKPTVELCHPRAGLDKFAMALGDWTHQTWIDFVDPRKRTPKADGIDKQAADKISQEIHGRFPQLNERLKQRQLDLPMTSDNLRFSPPVIFLGLFHGLHIDHYLSRTHVHNAAFIEPEPERFSLACGFLDFNDLTQRFNGLTLAVGKDYPLDEMLGFFKKSKVMSWLWTRVLPGYASKRINPILHQLRLQWLSQFESYVSFEREIQGMINGLNNVKRKRPILVHKPKLSAESRIAVVGSGPSLQNDLGWLSENKDKLIIFSVHSAVRHLKEHSIMPDFQFSLDTHWSTSMRGSLQLEPHIPLVLFYKVHENIFQDFEKPLLIVDNSVMAPFHTHLSFPHIYPTTGNLALAFACWCSPSSIYLLGLDFGFKSRDATHVQGGQFENNARLQEAHAGEEQICVEANFSGSSTVFTRSYYNEARLKAEQAISEMLTRTEVFNLADGARIRGAPPLLSSQIALGEYDKKLQDIESLLDSFQPAQEGTHWHPFPRSGQEMLNKLKKLCIQHVTISNFAWPEFTKQCDKLFDSLSDLMDSHGSGSDTRLEPYIYCAHRMLANWLRAMILTRDESEAAQTYSTGYQVFANSIIQLNWPENLDV